jgi:hypothetical protein
MMNKKVQKKRKERGKKDEKRGKKGMAGKNAERKIMENQLLKKNGYKTKMQEFILCDVDLIEWLHASSSARRIA